MKNIINSFNKFTNQITNSLQSIGDNITNSINNSLNSVNSEINDSSMVDDKNLHTFQTNEQDRIEQAYNSTQQSKKINLKKN